MRAAQQAYVAAGQGVAFWIPEVAALITTTSSAIDELLQSASSPDARRALNDAAASVSEFGTVDKRARDYLASGDQLMAADVVFSDGPESAATAAQLVDAAGMAEEQAVEAYQARTRRMEASVLGAAAGSVLLIVLLLTPRAAASTAAAGATESDSNGLASLSLRDVVTPSQAAVPRDDVPALKEAAELCTDFARVTDVEELTKLLARVAHVMDANGLIVWLGSPSGADLRPVLTHGYPPQAMAQMTVVQRSADNAAAAAYRSGKFQIVLARPGSSSGAVVAPLLAPGGCIGALTAELKNGSETSDGVQALGAIFAAQLSNVLASSVTAAEEPGTLEGRTAAG
jgi:hypothetical protein